METTSEIIPRWFFCLILSVTIMLRNKNVTAQSCVVSKMIRIKIDTKRVEYIMHDTPLAGL